MGRIIGLISLAVVLVFAILFILGIWGVVPFNFLKLGQMALTGVILCITFFLVFAIYGMFFWKGNERQLPSSSKEKAAQAAQRKADMS